MNSSYIHNLERYAYLLSSRIPIKGKRVGFIDIIIYNGSKEEVHQINAYSKITTLSGLSNNTNLVHIVVVKSRSRP